MSTDHPVTDNQLHVQLVVRKQTDMHEAPEFGEENEAVVKDKSLQSILTLMLMSHYLTRAVYSPSSDPVKPVVSAGRLCPGMYWQN